MQKSYDVAVIGAGPAGSTAAFHLAEQGFSVLVLDQCTFPRDKICGDALSGGVCYEIQRMNPEWLKALDQSAFPVFGTHGVRFFAPNGQSLDLELPESKYKNDFPGYLATRMDFDSFLVEKALNHPKINFLRPAKLLAFVAEEQEYVLHSSQGDFHCKYMVGADGAQGVVAKGLGLAGMHKKHYSAGLRQYYSGVSGFSERGLIELHFIPEVLPGYLWVFPLADGRANVGIGMRSDVIARKHIHLKQVMERCLKEHPALKNRFLNAQAMEKPKGFGLPLGSKKRKLSSGRALLVGDAASLIDPFSGEGIGNAMTSGRMAAQHIADFESGKISHFKSYDQAIYRKMGKELKVSSIMQRLLAFPALFNLIVKKANKNQAFQQLLMNMFNDVDLKAQLTKPSFYFQLFFK